MKNIVLFLTLVTFPILCLGQVSGNLSYSQSGAKARAEQREHQKHAASEKGQPATGTSTFVEADVLMNVKADEFVAVFGLSQEGANVEECHQKMDALVKQFTDAISELKIDSKDLNLDFVTQTKIYAFETMGNVSQEKLMGFELKKNLSIRYTDRLLLDKLLVAAARARIYDLIKVDYIVRDMKSIQSKLMEEAAIVIQQKTARYEKLLGIKLQPPAQVFAEKYATHFPPEMYDSYIAVESDEIQLGRQRQQHIVQLARKGKTFIFNGLDADGFDQVINPAIIEPVVQCTLFLKVKYEVEQPIAKPAP